MLRVIFNGGAMSADNGIYIVKFPDGYRVAHAQAIENIDYDPAGSELRKNYLSQTFGRSKVFADKSAALLAAHEMADECSILEYGVCYLGEYEAFTMTPNGKGEPAMTNETLPPAGDFGSTAGLVPGEPFVEDDGCICLDWSVGGMMLTMSVFPNGTIAYAWLTPGNVEPSGHGDMHAHPAVHEILAAVVAETNSGA
jgi:hypothetical protein